MAADDESVLTSLGHVNTDTVAISGSDRDVTLTVPFGYLGTSVDLTNGLAITWDTAAYKSVVASASGEAQIGGATVTITVTYNYITDGDGTPKGTTAYTVYVVRGATVPPVFCGTIMNEILSSETVTFTEADFTSRYEQNNGEALGYISISGSNPAFGTLRLSGSGYTFGTLVDISSVDQLTFEPVSTGIVSYDVVGYAVTDTSNPVGYAVLTITCYDVPDINSDIAVNASRGGVLTFSPSFFTSHCDMNSMPLVSVEITPTDTSCGTWSLNGSPFSSVKVVPAAQLGSLTFTANTEGTATFDWRVSNHGADFSSSASGTITVTSVNLTLSAYTSGSSLVKGRTWTVSPSHFHYSPSTATLSYIKITAIPNSTDGYLYLTTALDRNSTYGYPAISANTALNTGAVIPSSHIRYLRLATKSSSTSSEVSFNWTATTDMNVSSALWADAVTYTMSFVSGGTLRCSTDMNIPLVLPSEAISSRFMLLTGYSLYYVTFTVPNKNFGTLYLDYNMTTHKGTAVTASTKYYTGKTPNLANITFVPAAGNTGTDTISYTAYTTSGTYITGKISIAVSNSPGGTISLQTDKNTPLQLDGATIQSAFQSATGLPLHHVKFTLPSRSYGSLYYNFTSAGRYESAVSSSSVYYLYAARYLSLVSFVPHTDFTGTVSIRFIGYTEAGAAYIGKLVIAVVDSPAGIVTYSLVENGAVTLTGADFSDEFIGVTGSLLSYVTFMLPSNTAGILYYEYSSDTQTTVAASTKCYDGQSPDISDITFVPADDFIGTVTVTYTAYSTTGTAYTGKLKFNVRELSQTIYYTTEVGKPVSMSAGDFTSAFSLISSGKTLSYVTFELPPSSRGRFYYYYLSSSNYDSAVSEGKKYYVHASPHISRVSFVPASDYAGAFTISYTGYTSDGEAYTGKLKITITGSVASSVSYETNSVTPVTFSASDFAAAYTDGTLSYVKFTLPSSFHGRLYYGYTSPSSYTSPVSATTRYYVSNTPCISRVTFVPNSSFSGILVLEYEAYRTSGGSTSGTVLITVDSSNLDTVTYGIAVGMPIRFNADDFNTVFLEKTGSSLHCVKFSLPSSSYGRLYIGYVSKSDYTSAVSASKRYYRSYSPRLDDISFVPKAGYTGAVTISYSGYDSSGTAYAGKVIIDVGNSVPFTDMQSGYAWASDAVSYLYRNGIVNGSGDNQFSPAASMSRGDFVLMVARAFDLSGGTDNFLDVPVGSYYYDAIAAAKALGIVSGTNGYCYPDSPISRQDAMVIITRVLEAKGIPLAEGSAADLEGFADAGDVSDYALISVASLVKAGIIMGSGGRLYPEDIISRAEMAVILYRVLTM